MENALGVYDVPLVGLAKARTQAEGRTDERLVRLDLEEPIVLAPDEPALRILVKARDEAHRFAGRYQKKRRALAFGQGVLDGIPGVGPARKKRLLVQFGSVEALRNAPFEDLAAVPGIGERLARLIRERDPFIRLAGTGLACSFGIQAMINLGVAARLLPAKGMTLPFVSYGGSSMIAVGITVGMLLALTAKRPQGEMSDLLGRGGRG